VKSKRKQKMFRKVFITITALALCTNLVIPTSVDANTTTPSNLDRSKAFASNFIITNLITVSEGVCKHPYYPDAENPSYHAKAPVSIKLIHGSELPCEVLVADGMAPGSIVMVYIENERVEPIINESGDLEFVLEAGFYYFAQGDFTSGVGFVIYVENTPVIANWTTSKVFVNGERGSFDAYNIENHNYFKLREIAYALNGTKKQFEVEWDGSANAIHLTSGKEYTPVGQEITVIGAGNILVRETMTVYPTTSTIYLDGVKISVTAYNIAGANYFKLRDLGMAFEFGVDWDGTTNAVIISTDKGYNQ
jgi:hypothetical protein